MDSAGSLVDSKGQNLITERFITEWGEYFLDISEEKVRINFEGYLDTPEQFPDGSFIINAGSSELKKIQQLVNNFFREFPSTQRPILVLNCLVYQLNDNGYVVESTIYNVGNPVQGHY